MKYPFIKDYPKRFEVIPGGKQWRLRFVSTEALPEEDQWWRGMCYKDGTICIVKGMSRKLTFETFVHELIHALAYELKIPQLHNHHWIKKLEKAIPGLVLACTGMLPP